MDRQSAKEKELQSMLQVRSQSKSCSFLCFGEKLRELPETKQVGKIFRSISCKLGPYTRQLRDPKGAPSGFFTGFYQGSVGVSGFGSSWRFMGSCDSKYLLLCGVSSHRSALSPNSPACQSKR